MISIPTTYPTASPPTKKPIHTITGSNTIVIRIPTHFSFSELILAVCYNSFQKMTGEARAKNTPRRTYGIRLRGMASSQIISIIGSKKLGWSCMQSVRSLGPK